MTDTSSRSHSGTVTTTGWHRKNQDISNRSTYVGENGVRLHVTFYWTQKRQLFRRKSTFSVIILPTLGDGWNDRWGAFRFFAGSTEISFSAQMINASEGTATYGLSADVTAMMHDFFSHQTDFTFELHGTDGLLMALPMSNDSTAYVILSDAVQRALT